MLEVKLLEEGAKAPEVGHPGEDLGYDVFALEDTFLPYQEVTKVRTGIAVAAYEGVRHDVFGGSRALGNRVLRSSYVEKIRPLGLLIRDRSSMADKNIFTLGGVIDAGYRGEIKVLMTYTKKDRQFFNDDYFDIPYLQPYLIKAGDKIAQMVPVPVLTGPVSVVSWLDEASRGAAGFGSTGA